jgi:hypothetical protein
MKTPYSFACWQLRKLHKFDNTFAQEKNSAIFKLLNTSNPINLEIFQENDIPLIDIATIMVALGAKKGLKDYGITGVYDILRIVKDNLPDGKYVKSIYIEAKNALMELEKEGKSITPPDNILYFSKKGKSQSYTNNSKVYYFNDKILPSRVMNSINILDMPLRQGGDAIPRLFNVKGRKDVNIEIYYNQNCNSIFNLNFQDKLQEIKPYIFALRFKSNVKDKDSEIKKFNDSEIILVNQLLYKCDLISNDVIELDDYDFVSDIDEKQFYIKIPEYEQYHNTPQFQDSLTEIFSIIFNLSDESKLNDFRLVVSRIATLKSLTDNGFLLDEEVDESQKYCELKYTFDYKFWKSVFVQADKSLPEKIWKSNNELTDYAVSKLGISKPNFTLNDFNNNAGIAYLNLLKQNLNIDIPCLLKINKLSLCNFNIKKLRDTISVYEKQFITLWWQECNSDSTKQKDYFDRIYLYRELIDIIASKHDDDIINPLKYDLAFDPTAILNTIIKKYTTKDKWNVIEINFHINDYQEIKELDEYKDFFDLKDNDNRYLFYFSGNREIIKKLIEPTRYECFNSDNQNSLHPSAEWGEATAPEIAITNNKAGSRHKSHGSYNLSSDRVNQTIGATAENIVIKYFQENNYSFTDRRGASGESNGDDSFHYDFEYWKNDEPHRYLEVKYDGEIFISYEEKEFGLNFQNKSFYDIALVDIKKQKIKFIEKFFEFNQAEETFENNNKFRAIPVKYKIETKFNLKQ